MKSGFLEILNTLHDRHVEFVIVGGVAAALHGGSRVTFDLDLVPSLAPASWQAAVDLLWLRCYAGFHHGLLDQSISAWYTASVNVSRKPFPDAGDAAAMTTVTMSSTGSMKKRVPEEPSHQKVPSRTG